jgi:hypothetical protein
MKKSSLVFALSGLSMVLPFTLAQSWSAEATHHLAPTPKTVTIGYFDAQVPQVIRVNSGDAVELETLVYSGLTRL